MEINFRIIDKHKIIQPVGRLDSFNYPSFENTIKREIDDNKRQILLDFSNISYLSSSGLLTLVRLQNHLKKINGSLILHSIQPLVLQTIKISGFDKLFPIFDTMELAINFAETNYAY